MSQPATETKCCPPFNPGPWEDKTFEWAGKRFIKDKVFTLFHVPVNFGTVIKRMMGRVEKAGAAVPDGLCLADHTSPWNMDLYLAVDKEIPGTENVVLSGKYLSKVYEGAFKETGKWCADFKALAESRGLNVRKWFMWYTTCPKCAKVYGKNYVVIVAEI
jgi:hypothetical protein